MIPAPLCQASALGESRVHPLTVVRGERTEPGDLASAEHQSPLLIAGGIGGAGAYLPGAVGDTNLLEEPLVREGADVRPDDRDMHLPHCAVSKACAAPRR